MLDKTFNPPRCVLPHKMESEIVYKRKMEFFLVKRLV